MSRFLLSFLLSCFSFQIISSSAYAETVSGFASVIDGDTIQLGETVLNLYAIDAPEIKQKCLKLSKLYQCGSSARKKLSGLVDAQIVTCETVGLDTDGQTLAICYLGAIDVGDWLVRGGLAVAYTKTAKTYAAVQKSAKRRKLGLWKGGFVMPWEWRRGKRLSAESEKGSSSSNGSSGSGSTSSGSNSSGGSSSGGSSSTCCKQCSAQACGDSCISWSYTCHKGPGCAC